MLNVLTLASATSVAGASLATARVVTDAIVGCKRLLGTNDLALHTYNVFATMSYEASA